MNALISLLLLGCAEKEASEEAPCPEGYGMTADGVCLPIDDGESDADTDADIDTDTDTDTDADSDADTDTDADSDTDTDTDVDADNAAPQVLYFDSSSSSMTEGESVVFSAVVTDPDGIDDLIGGVLTSAEGSPYGSFATAEGEGAYQITLSWDEIHQIRGIEFTDTQDLTFTATFYDVSGASAEEEAALSLSCPETSAACDGKCVDLQNDDDYCGTCGESCLLGDCIFGVCSEFQECFLASDFSSCNQYCTSIGMTCDDVCSGSTAGLWYTDEENCETTEDSYTGNSSCNISSTTHGSTAPWMRCCCAP